VAGVVQPVDNGDRKEETTSRRGTDATDSNELGENLLHRTGNLRKHVIGICPDQPDCTYHDD
jgi:hypothetical protein